MRRVLESLGVAVIGGLAVLFVQYNFFEDVPLALPNVEINEQRVRLADISSDYISEAQSDVVVRSAESIVDLIEPEEGDRRTEISRLVDEMLRTSLQMALLDSQLPYEIVQTSAFNGDPERGARILVEGREPGTVFVETSYGSAEKFSGNFSKEVNIPPGETLIITQFFDMYGSAAYSRPTLLFSANGTYLSLKSRQDGLTEELLMLTGLSPVLIATFASLGFLSAIVFASAFAFSLFVRFNPNYAYLQVAHSSDSDVALTLLGIAQVAKMKPGKIIDANKRLSSLPGNYSVKVGSKSISISKNDQQA